MARSTSFLATGTRAVVRTRWRDCQTGDLTCQHKRPIRLRNTTSRRTQIASGDSTSHLSSWTAGPFSVSYESTYPSFLYFFDKLSLSVVLMELESLTMLVADLVQVPPTDSAQHTDTQTDRQTGRQARERGLNRLPLP